MGGLFGGALSCASLARDGASGDPAGKPAHRGPRRALGVCQFLETSRSGAGLERRDRPGVGFGSWPRVLLCRRVLWFPARRAPAL